MYAQFLSSGVEQLCAIGPATKSGGLDRAAGVTPIVVAIKLATLLAR